MSVVKPKSNAVRWLAIVVALAIATPWSALWNDDTVFQAFVVGVFIGTLPALWMHTRREV